MDVEDLETKNADNAADPVVRLGHFIIPSGVESSFLCKYSAADLPGSGLFYLELPPGRVTDLASALPAGWTYDFTHYESYTYEFTVEDPSGTLYIQFCQDDTTPILQVQVQSTGFLNTVYFFDDTASSWGAKAYCQLKYGGGLADVSSLTAALKVQENAESINVVATTSFFGYGYSQQMGDSLQYNGDVNWNSLSTAPCCQSGGTAENSECLAAAVLFPVFLTDFQQDAAIPSFEPCDTAWGLERSFACQVPAAYLSSDQWFTEYPSVTGYHSAIQVCDLLESYDLLNYTTPSYFPTAPENLEPKYYWVQLPASAVQEGNCYISWIEDGQMSEPTQASCSERYPFVCARIAFPTILDTTFSAPPPPPGGFGPSGAAGGDISDSAGGGGDKSGGGGGSEDQGWIAGVVFAIIIPIVLLIIFIMWRRKKKNTFKSSDARLDSYKAAKAGVGGAAKGWSEGGKGIDIEWGAGPRPTTALVGGAGPLHTASVGGSEGPLHTASMGVGARPLHSASMGGGARPLHGKSMGGGVPERRTISTACSVAADRRLTDDSSTSSRDADTQGGVDQAPSMDWLKVFERLKGEGLTDGGAGRAANDIIQAKETGAPLVAEQSVGGSSVGGAQGQVKQYGGNSMGGSEAARQGYQYGTSRGGHEAPDQAHRYGTSGGGSEALDQGYQYGTSEGDREAPGQEYQYGTSRGGHEAPDQGHRYGTSEGGSEAAGGHSSLSECDSVASSGQADEHAHYGLVQEEVGLSVGAEAIHEEERVMNWNPMFIAGAVEAEEVGAAAASDKRMHRTSSSGGAGPTYQPASSYQGAAASSYQPASSYQSAAASSYKPASSGVVTSTAQAAFLKHYQDGMRHTATSQPVYADRERFPSDAGDGNILVENFWGIPSTMEQRMLLKSEQLRNQDPEPNPRHRRVSTSSSRHSNRKRMYSQGGGCSTGGSSGQGSRSFDSSGLVGAERLIPQQPWEPHSRVCSQADVELEVEHSVTGGDTGRGCTARGGSAVQDEKLEVEGAVGEEPFCHSLMGGDTVPVSEDDGRDTQSDDGYGDQSGARRPASSPKPDTRVTWSTNGLNTGEAMGSAEGDSANVATLRHTAPRAHSPLSRGGRPPLSGGGGLQEYVAGQSAGGSSVGGAYDQVKQYGRNSMGGGEAARQGCKNGTSRGGHEAPVQVYREGPSYQHGTSGGGSSYLGSDGGGSQSGARRARSVAAAVGRKEPSMVCSGYGFVHSSNFQVIGTQDTTPRVTMDESYELDHDQ
eukprot:gene23184-30396_t